MVSGTEVFLDNRLKDGEWYFRSRIIKSSIDEQESAMTTAAKGGSPV